MEKINESTSNLNKVAKITLLFWVMKIIATTLGETLGDLLAQTLQLGYAFGLGITGVFFILVLFIQLKAKKYVPILFWLVIVGTTTVGTEVSDFMDRTLHLGYLAGSLILITLLLNTLWIWHRTIGKIEVYPIFNRKVELFYWTAILFSNSLGTAFGDFLSDNVGLSYLQGAMVTAGVIIIVVLLHYVTKINYIILFWIAFIFTRPFGATFGDLLTKPIAQGGLNLGTIPATLISITILGLLVFYSHKKKLD
ncbi:membrane protein [Aequorivita capsosiphonis]|uniref:COG4705 family protein n=1 Tax=Aequorivita capsosiphonis TaxID=487317 RepID=UPI00047C2447|nr:membrane protein [Aequorivita capsosiphonis]